MYLFADRNKTKACDKYLVTNLSGDWCQLWKFTKSQFRVKTYDVRITQCCYHVLHTTLVHSTIATGPIRSLDPPDVDSGSDSETPTFHLPMVVGNSQPQIPLELAFIQPPVPDTLTLLPPVTVDDVTPLGKPDLPDGNVLNHLTFGLLVLLI